MENADIYSIMGDIRQPPSVKGRERDQPYSDGTACHPVVFANPTQSNLNNLASAYYRQPKLTASENDRQPKSDRQREMTASEKNEKRLKMGLTNSRYIL